MWGAKKFYFGDNISVGVGDLNRAVAWYQEKLGLRLSPLKFEDCDALLVFSKDDQIGLALVSIPTGQTEANVQSHPILFSKQLEACREEFASRGISVGAILNDSGGNRFFRFQDLEGNEIEVCVEP